MGSKTLEDLCTINLSDQLLVSTVSPLLLRLGRRGKLQETARHIRASTILLAVIKWREKQNRSIDPIIFRVARSPKLPREAQILEDKSRRPLAVCVCQRNE